MSERRCCVECGLGLVKKPGPGRWPKRCPSCRPRPADRKARANTGSCPVCGETLSARRVDAKFCSDECCSAFHYAKNLGRTPTRIDLRKTRCAGCGAEMVGRRSNAKWCSDRCRLRPSEVAKRERTRARLADARGRPCGECGQPFDPVRIHARYCSRDCAQRAYRRGVDWRDKNHRRRATMAGVDAERIESRAILDRDKWVCQLCRDPIPRAASWPDPLSPSLDHVIPISKGGTHTVANLQAAHLSCNCKKGDRFADAAEQLRLVG